MVGQRGGRGGPEILGSTRRAAATSSITAAITRDVAAMASAVLTPFPDRDPADRHRATADAARSSDSSAPFGSSQVAGPRARRCRPMWMTDRRTLRRPRRRAAQVTIETGNRLEPASFDVRQRRDAGRRSSSPIVRDSGPAAAAERAPTCGSIVASWPRASSADRRSGSKASRSSLGSVRSTGAQAIAHH